MHRKRLSANGLETKKDFAACGRTKPPLARLCSFGQNTDSHTGFQLGERTKAGTESAVAATSAIRKNHEAGSERLEHADSQRRRIYPFGKPLQDIPEVDVVCYGLWVNPSLATHHGVFVSDRKKPEVLDFMLQKPSLEELEGLSKTHLFLMDIGIWILSDRAVEVLMKRSLKEGTNDISYYDLYSDYGLALGEHPQTTDDEVNKLSVAILSLPSGEFYHFGTSRELISSTLAIQDKVRDQRRIMHRKVKPNPAIFIQNSFTQVKLSAENANLWIENSHVGEGWKLGSRQIITGVPENHWNINLPDGVCIDIVPMGDAAFVARPYGLDDVFKGDLRNDSTTYLGNSFTQWMKEREIGLEDIKGRTDDLQAAPVFPVTTSIEELGILIRWMTAEPQLKQGKELWLRAENYPLTRYRHKRTWNVFTHSAALSAGITGKDCPPIMRRVYSISLTCKTQPMNLSGSIWRFPLS